MADGIWFPEMGRLLINAITLKMPDWGEQTAQTCDMA
jgi:hypothetical protein